MLKKDGQACTAAARLARNLAQTVDYHLLPPVLILNIAIPDNHESDADNSKENNDIDTSPILYCEAHKYPRTR